jgi:hypothetical protein
MLQHRSVLARGRRLALFVVTVTVTVSGLVIFCSGCPLVADTSQPTESLLNPPPTGSIVASSAVGTLPGSMTVGSDGSGRYHIPLVAPPGRMGVEPDLSLEYSSESGNGIVGFGWSLKGISSITPCGSSFGRDGMNRPREARLAGSLLPRRIEARFASRKPNRVPDRSRYPSSSSHRCERHIRAGELEGPISRREGSPLRRHDGFANRERRR